MKRFIATALLTGILAGCSGPATTPAATASGPLLASGTFVAKGETVELDARGSGDRVTGTMKVSGEDAAFTVDLKCGLTTEDGRILIGGDTTVSTSSYARVGVRTLIVLKPGSPVHAAFDFEVGAPVPTCLAFLESIMGRQSVTVIGDNALEPIEGTVELGP